MLTGDGREARSTGWAEPRMSCDARSAGRRGRATHTSLEMDLSSVFFSSLATLVLSLIGVGAVSTGVGSDMVGRSVLEWREGGGWLQRA